MDVEEVVELSCGVDRMEVGGGAKDGEAAAGVVEDEKAGAGVVEDGEADAVVVKVGCATWGVVVAAALVEPQLAQ
jgi:hypothetical protein